MINERSSPRTGVAVTDLAGTPKDANNGFAWCDTSDVTFRTEHLLPTLKARTISSGFVTFASQGTKFALTLGSTMVLAHLLSPRDFGLVAMATTITSFLRIFKDAGLSSATIQSERITHAQVSNLFWINLAVSGIVSVVVACLAPVVALFYREPRLVGVTLALSVTFLLNGSTVQHLAILNRQMRFKAIALIQVGSMSVGAFVGIVMALLGFGYWSLVGLNVSLEGAGVVFTWSVSRWRPQFLVRRSGTRSLLEFGANITGGGFVYCLACSVDSLLIGRFYGAEATGLYSRAMALLMRPLEQFLIPVGAVFQPTLARLQTDSARYRRVFLQLYEAIALVSFPFTGLLLALAHPITLVLLGPKWEKAAIIFGGFTIAALYVPFASISMWLLTSQGRGKDILLANTILGACTAAAFVAGLPFGPVGVAIAFSVSGFLVRLPILYYIVGRRGPVSTTDLRVGFLKHLPIWMVVFEVAELTRILTAGYTPLIQLLVCTPAGLLAAVAFVIAIPSERRSVFRVLNIWLELKTGKSEIRPIFGRNR